VILDQQPVQEMVRKVLFAQVSIWRSNDENLQMWHTAVNYSSMII